MPRTNRTCEICQAQYEPTYSKQRTCGRTCGWTLRGRAIPEPNGHDLDAPLTAERLWLAADRKRKAAANMLRRYHTDPRNWTTAKKRRRLFERDGWQCRVCSKTVSNHPTRAVAGHIVARATGGEWTDENMATLCRPCNVADGVNRIPIQMAF